MGRQKGMLLLKDDAIGTFLSELQSEGKNIIGARNGFSDVRLEVGRGGGGETGPI